MRKPVMPYANNKGADQPGHLRSLIVPLMFAAWIVYSTAKETHILLSRFTSLKVMIFYFLLSKQICLCMAIGFAAFSCHNAIGRKNMLIFVKKRLKSQNSCSLCRTQFSMRVCGT